jgi:hypothetical protein
MPPLVGSSTVTLTVPSFVQNKKTLTIVAGVLTGLVVILGILVAAKPPKNSSPMTTAAAPTEPPKVEPTPAKAETPEPAKPDTKVLSTTPPAIPAPAPDPRKLPAPSRKHRTPRSPTRRKATARPTQRGRRTKVASTIPPATLVFAVTPWGEIFVNGKSRGVVPPMKTLKLDPGKYRIEIRNTTFPVYAESLDLKAGRSDRPPQVPMSARLRFATVGIVLGLVAAGCEQLPTKPAPAAPQITEESLRTRANDQLALGIKQYNDGEFDNAVKTLNASLEHGLLSKVDASRARKYLAFSHCVSNREAQCRAEFRKAFEINTDFSLSPAEDGHPIWGPVYRNVRTQLIAEREAFHLEAQGIARQGRANARRRNAEIRFGRLRRGAEAPGKRDEARPQGQGGPGEGDEAHCLHAVPRRQMGLCRATFVKIYDIDPDFDLTPAEAGHPSWTKTFAGAKAQAKKAIADKAIKEKAPVAPVAVPKKN